MKKLSILVGTFLLSGLSLAWAEKVEFKDSVKVDGDVNVNGQYAIGGYQVLDQDPVNSNLFLGFEAGHITQATAEYNTFLGLGSGGKNEIGSFNTYVGSLAGYGQSTPPNKQADNNVFIGYAAGNNILDGDNNVTVGYRSAQVINDGYQNVLIGSEVAQELTVGYDNVMIGYRAGRGIPGADPEMPVVGQNNVLVGSYAGEDIGSGKENTFVGHKSGEDNTTGSYNVYLGTAAGWYNQTGNGNIFIGHLAGGDSTFTAVNNQLFIDNSNTKKPLIWGDFEKDRIEINGKLWVWGTIGASSTCCSSDVRLKENIAPLGNVLAKVMALNGVRFNWRSGTREAQFAAKDSAQLGVVAQEIEKYFPELVGENPKGYKTVDYQKLIAPLIEAVKELKKEKDREIAALKSEKDRQIEALKVRLQALEERSG